MSTMRASAAVVAAAAGLCAGGCMRAVNVQSDIDAQVQAQAKANVDAAIKVETNPNVQVHMNGPTIRYEGVYVSEKLFDRIHPQKTATDGLLPFFGEPTGKAKLRDGSEIWKWTYKPVEQGVSVVSLFGGNKEQPSPAPTTTFVRIDNDVVVEKWRD